MGLRTGRRNWKGRKKGEEDENEGRVEGVRKKLREGAKRAEMEKAPLKMANKNPLKRVQPLV